MKGCNPITPSMCNLDYRCCFLTIQCRPWIHTLPNMIKFFAFDLQKAANRYKHQTWHIHGEADMKELRDAVAQQAQKVQVPQWVEELLTYPLRSKPRIWQVYFVRSLGLFWHSSNIVWRLFPQVPQQQGLYVCCFSLTSFLIETVHLLWLKGNKMANSDPCWGSESASDVQWWRRQEEKEEERRIWATEAGWWFQILFIFTPI